MNLCSILSLITYFFDIKQQYKRQMKPILEKIDVDKNKSISAFRYAHNTFTTPWHFHPQYELTYIDQSIGTKFVGDYVGSYMPGELVLVGSNLPHCWKDAAGTKDSAVSYVLQWNQESFPDVAELRKVNEMLKHASRGIIFQSHQVRKEVELIKEMMILGRDRQYSLLLHLLIELSHKSYTPLSNREYSLKINHVHEDRISLVHEFVEKNYDKKVHLEDVSQLLNINQQSFSRFFSRKMGRPFFTYLNEYRVSSAVRLLILTDKPVSEIALECGYESLSFFHKQFKKFMGQSPLRYRSGHLNATGKQKTTQFENIVTYE